MSDNETKVPEVGAESQAETGTASDSPKETGHVIVKRISDLAELLTTCAATLFSGGVPNFVQIETDPQLARNILDELMGLGAEEKLRAMIELQHLIPDFPITDKQRENLAKAERVIRAYDSAKRAVREALKDNPKSDAPTATLANFNVDTGEMEVLENVSFKSEDERRGFERAVAAINRQFLKDSSEPLPPSGGNA